MQFIGLFLSSIRASKRGKTETTTLRVMHVSRTR